MRPMLATKGTYVPRGEEWVHEVKWDGVRALTEVRDGRLRMFSRNGNDITIAWPELSTSPLGDRDLLVDGEIIALNEHGLPDFRMLQDRMHLRNAQTARRLAATVPATYMVFDLLRLDGEDLTQLCRGRSAAPGSRAWSWTSTWQVPAAYDDGAMLLDATKQQGLEGVVSKRRSSTVRLRPAHGRLAQARAPAERVVRGRRLAAAGRLLGRQPGRRAGGGDDDRRAALPRPGRQRHRPEGRRPADQAAGRPRPRRQPVRRRGADASTRRARTGSSRSWSSTSTATRPPRTSACASRPTAACAPT